MAYNILIIEDQKELSDLVKQNLENKKYKVKQIFTGSKAILELDKGNYDVVVLDVILPERNGLEILRIMRASKNYTPVLLMTTRSSTDNIVEGLMTGADDYLPKPFKIEELLARIEAIIRRTKGSFSNKIRVADLLIDTETKTVHKNNVEIELSSTEFKILFLLIKNLGVIVSRDQIIKSIWNNKTNPNSGTIDVHINAIRTALDVDDRNKYIKTAHGMGYVIEEV